MWKTTTLLTNKDLFEAAKQLLAISELEPMESLVSDLIPSTGIKENETFVNGNRLYRFCAVHFPCSLSLKLWIMFASVKEEKKRERAITRLKSLLLEYGERGRLAFLHDGFVQELANVLVAFLAEEVISEELFSILAEVVSNVAILIFTRHRPWWDELRDYMTSKANTELKRSVYFLMNLTFPLDGERFVTPLLKNLFPSILNSLEPSRGREGDDNWRVAFVGAFCLAIQLMGTIRIDLTDNLAYQMLKSLKEVENSDMGTELVDLALGEVGMMVRRDSDRYSDAQIGFVSVLMSMIDELHGLRKQTRALVRKIWFGLEKANAARKFQTRIDHITEWLHELIA